MDFSLSDEQRGFARSFEQLCRERIAPRAREADQQGVLSRQSWNDLIASGYLKLFHPKELGGSGADGITQAIAMECLAKACASTMWVATISSALCGKILHNLCGPQHRQRWLEPIIAGERI